MSFPDTKHSTEWIKFPNTTKLVFVGRDILALGTGCHIYFFSLTLGTQKIYSATNPHMGDGVQCYTGHRTLPILAFAEKSLNPRIIFLRYSDFEKIKILPDGAPEGYQALEFSDVEYFITLSSLPEFELIVWNWRTGDKLAVERTNINNTNQFLSVNYNYPVNFVQYYENSSTLLLWEIHFGYKNVILIKNEINLPYNDTVINVTWNPEGNLYILNKTGCIYTLNNEFKLSMIIQSAIFGNTRPCCKWYKGGLIVMDLNLQIKHFKKGIEGTVDWYINPVKIKRFLTTTTVTGKEYLIAWTEAGEILELDIFKRRIISKKDFFSNIIDFCLIYPLCDYFVSLCLDGKSVKIWDALIGKEINITTIEDKIKVIASNPIYPYVTIGLYNGTLIFISYYKIETPTILAKFNLTEKEINKIIYNEAGNLIVAARMEEGIFFILKALPGEKIEIISYINYQQAAIDIAILDNEKSYKLLILVQSENNKNTSNKIHMKMILKSNFKVKKKNYKSNHLITNIIVLNNTLIAKIFDKQNLTVFQLQKKNIKFTNNIVCKNHPFNYVLKTNGRNLFTCSVNGLLTIFNDDYSELLATFLVHHRKDGGIINALIDPFLRFIITLGQKNELVYSKITQSLFDEKKYKEVQNSFNDYKDCFVQSSEMGFEENITYVEQKQRFKILQEQNKYAKERKEIMEEFQLLKNEVVNLYEQNLYGPENEKIVPFEFYLHVNLRKHKEKLCEQECEWVNQYYNELIRAQNELWECLKKKFWDTQLIKRGIINGIFSNFHVENYGLIPDNPEFQSKCKYFLMMREFEETVRAGDILLPWTSFTQSHLKEIISKPPCLEYNVDNRKQINSEDYPSSLARQFLDEFSFYDQGEIHTFTQSFFQKYLINQASLQLRQIFNKTFNEVIDKKRDIMKSILEMNARLRFILSELEINDIFIKDPEWHLTEVPENIICIQNHELTTKPYISESCQALLDENAAKAERIRLILLADDFREKTLSRIMDGLLEVRWEDTLKWDVTKPQCMFDKRPEKYNTDDLREVNEYENKVEFLNSERQKYREILRNEYLEISETVRKTIKNFNSELSGLSLFKIKIETARLQHSLMVQLMQNACFKREDFEKRERAIRDEIKKSDKRIIWINNKLSELIDASNECKMFAETLSIKDKTVEKNFKKDIQDYSALVQEHGYKLFKKQPKGNFINVNSPTLLNGLGVCVVSQEKSQLLTIDCLEFLKSVDKLDEYVGVPNSIDETVYKIICKYRRMRIEVEIRTKANQLEQIDIDAGVQYFQKLLTDRKESATHLSTELSKLRIKKIELVHDKLLQIVVKRGLVEIPTLGFIFDYDGAVLVDRHEIEKVNSVIQKAGQRKLRILKAIMMHRREITEKEWEHKKKRMEIEDLKQSLYIIEKIKVTKELQKYLNQKQRSKFLQKDVLSIDQEFESTRKTYDRILEERKKAINELDKQMLEYKKKNYILDKKISEINVDICEHEIMRDVELEVNYKSVLEKRMKSIIKRSAIIKNIQEQHNEILVLQTELELARLKTYPTLKLKTTL